MTRTVRILGTHGVPAAYGGFETAAQHVAMYLRDRGWNVVVYCQLDGDGDITSDRWNGIERVLVPEPREGWKGTSHFDLVSIRHATAHHREGDVWLTFGYNTGVLDVMPRLRGIPNVINMDGMEWTRRRWGLAKQAILLGNERLAGLVGDVLIGDHPVISAYLRRHFGARRADHHLRRTGGHQRTVAPVSDLARPRRVRHRRLPADSGELRARDRDRLVGTPPRDAARRGRAVHRHRPVPPRRPLRRLGRGALPRCDLRRGSARRVAPARGRVRARAHRGRTNPSLVEAMGAGNAVIAHDNRYNSWVAGPDNAYFRDADDLAVLLDELLPNAERLHRMGEASRTRYREEFTWEHIGAQYEHALLTALARHGHVSQRTEVLV
jgi:hypothetical protein